jgi:hypothetical protein
LEKLKIKNFLEKTQQAFFGIEGSSIGFYGMNSTQKEKGEKE